MSASVDCLRRLTAPRQRNTQLAHLSWLPGASRHHRCQACCAALAVSRLASTMLSLRSSPVSWKMAAAPRHAEMASSNRRTSRKAMPRLPRAMPSCHRSAGLPEDGGRFLQRGDGLVKPACTRQGLAQVCGVAPSPWRSVSRKMAAASCSAAMTWSSCPGTSSFAEGVPVDVGLAAPVGGFSEDGCGVPLCGDRLTDSLYLYQYPPKIT